MSQTDAEPVRPARVRDDRVLRITRIVALLLLPFLIVAVILLSVFPDRTGELFAWPIAPPLSAYLLASAYVGGIWVFARIVRTRRWHRVVVAYPPVIVFTSALLVATLLHLDRFSQNVSFYTWFVLYLTTPFLTAWVWWLQRGRDDGEPESSDARVPIVVRGIMVVVGLASLMTGAVLFLVPNIVIPLWAWDVTPLTARVLGAVLSLPGVVSLWFLRDTRWSSFRIVFQAQIVSLIAIGCSLFAGRDALHWDRPATPGFLALVGIAFVGYVALYVGMEVLRRRDAASEP
ncbi:hypothetical protein NQ152_11935 [Microbacterium sp. zg.B48]|uniref:hypothetical protein n=1 Tax=Microbacterium sp. zg.B48 TaxID=2969408 RepID=UPI00214CD2A8|nr:hypothetical protein [Microbacterium sp. zg.B48]MCR2764213.1 hypothetical protein [Microbacterium sp. zg.B48]